MRPVPAVLTTSPEEAAVFIRNGRLAAFPTETVYGLGADAFNPEAVRAVFEAKERPADNPLIVHIARLDQLDALAEETPAAARALIDRFLPGPLTLVLPRRAQVPPVVSAGLETVGVRMPRHPVARAFLTACRTPVAAPSANRSGRPSPTTWQAVRDDLGPRIDCILQAGRTEIGLESTVVDGTGAAPVVLRAGAVTLEMLRAVCPETTAAPAAPARQRSPGTRHRHYAPRASVHLVAHPQDAVPDPRHAYIGLVTPAHADRFARVRRCDTVAQYAHGLFHFFHLCDAAGCTRIYCQQVSEEQLGRALMDRLRRAALL